MYKRQGSFAVHSSTTTWLQVNQDRPSEDEWKLWRKANLLWSDPDGILHTPLQAWLLPRARQRQQHFAYLRRRRLYIRISATHYQVCIPTLMSGDYRFHTRQRHFSTIKPDALPIDVIPSPTNPDHWRINIDQVHGLIPLVRPDHALTFASYVDTL